MGLGLLAAWSDARGIVDLGLLVDIFWAFSCIFWAVAFGPRCLNGLNRLNR
jgi:hypothetical protein